MVTNYFLFMVKWPLFKTGSMHLLPNQEDGLHALPVNQKNTPTSLYTLFTLGLY